MSKPKKAIEAVSNTLQISDPWNVPVVFANSVVGSGHYLNNVNITFAVAKWSPSRDMVDPDLAVCARLRMDMVCAEQLYAELGKILQQLKPANATTQ